jgi:two-component system CheB/CheR fusion protein
VPGGGDASGSAARPGSPELDRSSAFPIVGLGASAGGLEALRRLLGVLPADIGAALVVIQHLDPERPSLLTSVLAGATVLGVVEAASGMAVERNRVYVIPSGSDLTIQMGRLTLVPRRATGRLHLPIDSFFRALAEDKRGGAIGVVLSGSGADGTEGLRAIKAEGGIAIVQSPDSAQFRSMPESALVAGVADFSGPPEGIARELARLSHHSYLVDTAAQQRAEGESEEPGEDAQLMCVLELVRQQSGIDFCGYKRSTVKRRIERRMALRRSASLGEYEELLREDPAEARAMSKDMLIHVTEFFRDADAFDALEREVLREMAKNKSDGSSIRIWVPGCSTGEEVYSVAVSLLAVLEERPSRHFNIKIFGSDLSTEAVETARAGFYSTSALAEVRPERRLKFFDRVDAGYRVGKRVRDLCVFVKQDLTRDPPFAKLDLVCCRNVLIYLDTELQRRVIPMLHYCLVTPGYLFLGQSEAMGGFRDLFTPVDKQHRIFLKTGESPRMSHPPASGRETETSLLRTPDVRPLPAREAQRQADYWLLGKYAPAGVLVNEAMDIVQFRGRTGAFLESPPGQPDVNILRMARDGLASRLREMFDRARAQSVTVGQRNVQVETDTGPRAIDLEVVPMAGLSGAAERFFLVLFRDSDAEKAAVRVEREPGATRANEEPRPDADEVSRLKGEVVATKDYLRAIVAEHQATSDELAAANEEMVAANEELQSTNEELQSAKEELQSANEELNTVNEELRNRNVDLDQIANDLVNVLASVDIPVIIVDMDLKVRRFTPKVRTIAAFIPEDIGRPIDDLKLKIKVENLPEMVRGVIHDLVPKEWEIDGPEGRWIRLQVRPYRTADNRLDGAVLAFVDVDTLKRALKDAELARDYAKSIVETVKTALVVLDARLEAVSANHAFYSLFDLSPNDVVGKSFFVIGAGAVGDPDVRRAFANAAASHSFADFELESEFPRVGRKALRLSGRSILGGGAPMTLVAVDDLTDFRALSRERTLLLDSEKQARMEAERANRAKDLFLATLSHELRTPLSSMLLEAQLLARISGNDSRLKRASSSIERSAKTQARLIEDLLDVSRIVSGKLLLDLRALDLKEIVQSSVDMATPAAEAKSVQLELEACDDFVGVVYGDAIRLQQVVTNLIANAIKFTPRGGRIAARLTRTGEQAQIAIADTGMGIRPEVLPHLFARFVQADSSVTRAHGGLGLGLAIVRHLVEAHGGQVRAESPGEGAGATLLVTLPIGAAIRTEGLLGTVARDISGVRVLLVEDDDDTRASFVAMLELLGADVHASASAPAALAAMADFHPQVILSDIAMPGEDGYSFIRKVRRLPPDRGGTVAAAALTALASDEDQERAKGAGFQMHVTKPVDAVRLASAVRTMAAMTDAANAAAAPP